MITLPVVDPEGKQVSTITIDPVEFGGEVNKQLLHDAVVMYQANRRVGTHKAKTRGEVAGTGKKLYRQKGTGNARAGSRRSNVRRGGGVVHGPRPRDYSYSMPKKARRLATRMALLSKLQDEEAVIIQGLSIEAPKTKEMVGVLGALGLAGEKCLVATSEYDKNIYLSSRNIDGVEVLPARELNALSLLKQKRLLLTIEALDALRTSGTAGDAAASQEDGEE